MTVQPIPACPVVIVDVRADGSGHLNVAGRHVDYPPGSAKRTRAAIIQDAAELARDLRRPVRMTSTDTTGTYRLAAHPDATVTALDEDGPRRRAPRRRRVDPTAASGATAPIPTSRTPQPAPLPATTAEAHSPSATAILTFSTGEVAYVTDATLIGRRPAACDGEAVAHYVPIADRTLTVSKTHARVEWNGGALWLTDRGSANGTLLECHGDPVVDVGPYEPYELRHGDTVQLGALRATITIPNAHRKPNWQ